MAATQFRKGKTASVPVGLMIGGMTSVSVTLVCSAIAAKLVDGEILAENKIGYAVMGILILSAWAGGLAAWNKIRSRRLVMCLASGAIYFSVLLGINALFFQGMYSGAGETALLIFCGSMLGVLPGFREKRSGNRKKIKMRNR